jgi:hypothetical protein
MDKERLRHVRHSKLRLYKLAVLNYKAHLYNLSPKDDQAGFLFERLAIFNC